ncbi:MAG TPA: hypothetical protein VFQ40_03815 [Actinomycetota bacterium]|nr:hypothetical protein [Actinomycetota bacterium]
MIRVLPMLLALVVLLAIASWGVRWAAARAPRLTTRRGVRGPGGYGFDRRSDQVKRRLQGVEGPDERRDEITTFLDVHRGVEAYVEPKTVMSPRSVVLVDADGHWRRFDLREDAFLRRVAAERGVPIFDAALTGYPPRMRRRPPGETTGAG